jgi:hypothetical protein
MDQPCIMQANATILIASIVMIDTSRNNTVIPCTSNAKAFGVAQLGSRDASIPSITTDPPESAEQGEMIEVYTAGRTCLCRAGGSITPGAYIKSGDANGAGVVCADTSSTGREYSVGIALEAALSGERFKMLVFPQELQNP